MAGKPHAPRNYVLAGGITRYSRSAMYKRKAQYRKKKLSDKPAKEKKVYYKIKEVKGEKNGGKRAVLLKKSPRYYPTEDVRRKLRSRKVNKPPKLRASITPGTVLILLSGRHKGKRVLFLKQLESGLLLVTGPYAINGVPLRRVSQRYVIATQTKVDITGTDLPERLSDDYFRRTSSDSKSKGMFADSKQEYTVSDERKADQKTVDVPLLAAIKREATLRQYMSATFSLHHGQYPHRMAF